MDAGQTALAPATDSDAAVPPPASARAEDVIRVRGARLHNLRGVSLDLPKNRLTVLTGLSGSGKSSLAFDTLHREGQRQYLESLGMVTNAVSRPPVDGITGLSPSITVDQHAANRSPRSTVGTVTEVFSYLRLLWARIGHRPCPGCGRSVPPSHRVPGGAGDGPDAAPAPEPDREPEPGGGGAGDGGAGDGGAGDAEDEAGPPVPCPYCRTPVPEPVMAHFSFNKPAGACPGCTGLGVVLRPDPEALLDPARSVAGGAVRGWHAALTAHQLPVLRAAARHYGLEFDPDLPVGELGEAQRDLLLHGVRGAAFRRRFPGVEPPARVAEGRFEGVATTLLRRYTERAADPAFRERTERLLLKDTCPDCAGARLRPASRAVTVAGTTIVQAQELSLRHLAVWLEELRGRVADAEWPPAEPIVADLRERVARLVDVGVGYLSLGQAAPSLSAGEAQRLRLAALLGSGLTGVLYVLDEPTAGLHPADVAQLVGVLRRLRDLGNTVLVVEHNLQVLRAADHLVDIGPGAGRRGGRVVAAGSPRQVAGTPGSVTGDCLAGRLRMPEWDRRRPVPGRELVVRGARGHNLRDVTVRLPLGLLTVVTGPSGSGKSSLLLDTLAPAARRLLHGTAEVPGPHDGVDGLEQLDAAVTVDQQPISRSPRSNAATYADVLTPVREAFAATAAARERGLTPGHFSFNVPGGRCERCAGAGTLPAPMQFLPDVAVRCPACRGSRFSGEVLEVRHRGRSIAEVLEMTVAEALDHFARLPRAAARLRRLDDVGLGYLRLGQPATTLSGGEAQRLKLAKELGARSPGRPALYVLDEPTTGLHPADTVRLVGVLRRLVEAGSTVLVIEHDTDVIRAADWVVDLGPEGGAAGGRVVAEGTPEQVAASAASRTGAFLRDA